MSPAPFPDPSPAAREALFQTFDLARATPPPGDRGATATLVMTGALAAGIGVAVTASLLGAHLPGPVAAGVYGGLGLVFALGLVMLITRVAPEEHAAEQVEAALAELVTGDPTSDPDRTWAWSARLLAAAAPTREGVAPIVDAGDVALRLADAQPWVEAAERALVGAGRMAPFLGALDRTPAQAAGDTLYDAGPVAAEGDTVLGVPAIPSDRDPTDP